VNNVNVADNIEKFEDTRKQSDVIRLEFEIIDLHHCL
jgi:hypothetical protein